MQDFVHQQYLPEPYILNPKVLELLSNPPGNSPEKAQIIREGMSN